MLRCALALLAMACIAASVDLAHKAAVGATQFHGRSAAYIAVVVLLSVAWAAAIVVTRSPSLALGGGIVLGGAIGNVLSLAFWPGVPNPFEVAAVAFNLADVFVVAGFVAVAASTAALALRDGARLHEPVRLR